MSRFKILKKCRLCKSSNLKTSFNLGRSPLCDQHVKIRYKQTYFPLKLQLCSNCGFSQINCVVNKNYIYKNYNFEIKSSKNTNSHFLNYANKVAKKTNLKKNDLVLDIGGSDDTLLKKFKKKKYQVLAVVPSEKVSKNSNKNGIDTINSAFNKKIVKNICSNYKKPKVITMNNLFANVDDLNSFSDNLFDLIDEKGSIIIESSYLGYIFKNKIFDWIYHDHLSYFSINPIKSFFEKKSFKLYDLDASSAKGGSIRYYFTNISNTFPISKSVKRLLYSEKKNKINSLSSFKKFKINIDKQKKKLKIFLNGIKPHSIVGYGASATSITLLSYFKISNFFKYLIDDNPSKIGLYSPGYHLPVFGVNILKDNPIEIVVILAWRYKDSILKKLKMLKKKHKIKKLLVIVPLPDIKFYRL